MNVPNWPQVIRDLEASGLSQVEIAALAGYSQAYVSQLKHGARDNVEYSKGVKLVSAWQNRQQLRAAA